MDLMRLSCPYCKEEIQIPTRDVQSGERFHCPECGERLRIGERKIQRGEKSSLATSESQAFKRRRTLMPFPETLFSFEGTMNRREFAMIFLLLTIALLVGLRALNSLPWEGGQILVWGVLSSILVGTVAWGLAAISVKRARDATAPRWILILLIFMPPLLPFVLLMLLVAPAGFWKKHFGKGD